LLDFRAYTTRLPPLVLLLVAPLEGSIIDQAGGDVAWSRKSYEEVTRLKI